MTIMNAAFTIGAVFSGSTTETPGLLLVEDGSSATRSNVSITSCTAETVVVSRSSTDSLLLRPGHILAYIGNEESGSGVTSYDDGLICTSSCSPLFRKIVAAVSSSEKSSISHESKNDITYTTTTTFATTFATFSEVFPPDLLLDESIADAYVEPQFDCGHSITSSTVDEPPHRHRELQINPLNPWYCSFLPPLISIMRCAGCCFPCCIPCIFILVNMALLLSMTCFFGRRRLYDKNPEGGEAETETETMNSFPPNTCQDWMSTDSNGNCFYVNCNIASINFDEQQDNHSSGQSCFSWDKNNYSFHENHQMFHFDRMSSVAVLPDSNIFFSEAWCMQDYCYASKFSKTTCDNNVYKVMNTKCSAHSTIATETIFPLTPSTLDQNCRILTMIFYLNMKLFGHVSYNHLQMKQMEYQETMCRTPTY